MNFYKRHIGDISKACAHLSQGQMGAYDLLLDWLYGNEKPLPLANESLYRIARASSKAEKANTDAVIGEFFVRTDDGYIQKRASEEIAKANERAETNRRIAEEREATKRARKEHESCSKREPSQTPDTRHQIQPNGCESAAHDAKPVDTRFAPEPDHRRKPMTADWQPGSEYGFRLSAAGPPPTADELSRFRSYWIGKGVNTESDWTEKLVVDLKRYRSQPNANTQGTHKPRGFEAGDASVERWAAEERAREASGVVDHGFG